MLPLPYSQNRAFSLLSGFLDDIQSRLQPVLRTRTVTRKVNGAKQTFVERYLVPPKAISDGAQATARALIRFALEAIIEVRQTPFLLEAATDAAPTPPPVATNGEALAKFRKVSARTIRNHIAELKQVGIITASRVRGTRANYELWISTKFLWKTDSSEIAPKKAINSTKDESATIGSILSTNFPLIVLEKQDTKEITSSPVEKLVSNAAGSELTGNTGLAQGAKPAKIAENSALEASGAENEITEAGGAAAPAAVEKPAMLSTHREMVLEFVDRACRTLYTGCSYSEQELSRFRNAVWEGVYWKFHNKLTLKQWQQYHEQALERLRMAASYFRRHRDKKVPAPFAVVYAGQGYFDQENTRGFVGTLAWHEKAQVVEHQWQVRKALRRARKELKQYRLGTAPARVQEMSGIQLYRYHENQLRALGADALREFRALVACPRH